MFEAVWCVKSRHFYWISTASPEKHPNLHRFTWKHPSFAEDSNDCLQPPRNKELLSAMSKVRAQLWMEIQNQDAAAFATSTRFAGGDISTYMAHSWGFFCFCFGRCWQGSIFLGYIDVVGILGGPTVDEVVGKNASETAELPGIPLQITSIQVGEDDQKKRGHLFLIYRGCIVHYIFLYIAEYKNSSSHLSTYWCCSYEDTDSDNVSVVGWQVSGWTSN